MADTTAFELVTPSRLMASRDAGMVVVPGRDGLFGVLPRHIPLVSTLQRGVIEVHDGGKVTDRYMVDSGVADVTGERCTILAERAELLDSGQRDDLKRRLGEAEEAGNEDEAGFIRAAMEAI